MGGIQKAYGGDRHFPSVCPLHLQCTMTTENLKDSIKQMMVESLMLRITKEQIQDEIPLFGPEGLGLDSIDALELVVSLEKQFGVSVPNSAVARTALATVNSIHDYIHSQRSGG